MLVAVSAADAVAAIDCLHALHEKNVGVLTDGTNKKQFTTLTKLFSYLEAHPMIEVKKTAEAPGGYPITPVSRAVAVLIERGYWSSRRGSAKHGFIRMLRIWQFCGGDT